jgi:hypothetical protein
MLPLWVGVAIMIFCFKESSPGCLRHADCIALMTDVYASLTAFTAPDKDMCRRACPAGHESGLANLRQFQALSGHATRNKRQLR